MFRSFTLVLAAAMLAACFGNSADTAPKPGSHQAKRAADIQKRIDRLRCDFAAVVVENDYRDPIVLYTLRYPLEQSGTGMGGSISAVGTEEVFCISQSRLSGNGQLILRAQTSRGSIMIRDRVESELLTVQQGEVWHASVNGNAFNGLNNIAFLRERGVSVRAPSVPKPK